MHSIHNYYKAHTTFPTYGANLSHVNKSRIFVCKMSVYCIYLFTFVFNIFYLIICYK